jgi:hypothetical protein
MHITLCTIVIHSLPEFTAEIYTETFKQLAKRTRPEVGTPSAQHIALSLHYST